MCLALCARPWAALPSSLFLVPFPSREAQCMTFQTPHSSRVGGTLPMRGNGLVCSALSLHLNGLKEGQAYAQAVEPNCGLLGTAVSRQSS